MILAACGWRGNGEKDAEGLARAEGGEGSGEVEGGEGGQEGGGWGGVDGNGRQGGGIWKGMDGWMNGVLATFMHCQG